MFALPDAWEVKAKPTLYHPPQTVTPYSTYTWSRVILLLTLRKDAPSYAEHKFCPHTQAPSSGSPPPDCMSGSSSPNPEHSVFLNWRRARICGKEASWLPVIPFLSVALQFLNIFTSFQTCHNLGNTPVRFIRFLAKMVSKSLWFFRHDWDPPTGQAVCGTPGLTDHWTSSLPGRHCSPSTPSAFQYGGLALWGVGRMTSGPLTTDLLKKQEINSALLFINTALNSDSCLELIK